MSKYFKRILLLLFFATFFITAPSCTVIHRHDNGRHYGWYKKGNSQHPSQRGKAKGHSKKGKPSGHKGRH